MASSDFDRWASVYDRVYSYVAEDIPFYVDEAKRSGGPVLELGCGTGRVSIPIAKAGVDIVGVDFSEPMLAVARGKSESLSSSDGALTLVHADMRDLSLGQTFRLVIVPFRGFLSLLTVEDQVKTLENVKRHLEPGGRLVFNVFVPDLNMLLQEGDTAYHLRDVIDPDTGSRLVLWQQSAYDNHNQLINARVSVEDLDANGSVVNKLYRDFQLRYAFRWELHHLLVSCGYDVVDLFGDFERTPFDETSGEMVWVASPSP